MDGTDIRKVLTLVALGDPSAAGMVRQLASKLLALADRLEAGVQNPTMSPGGMGDHVRMNVVGPDGAIKQTVDTAKGFRP